MSQLVLQTPPQVPFMQISTNPWVVLFPPIRRTFPLIHSKDLQWRYFLFALLIVYLNDTWHQHLVTTGKAFLGSCVYHYQGVHKLLSFLLIPNTLHHLRRQGQTLLADNPELQVHLYWVKYDTGTYEHRVMLPSGLKPSWRHTTVASRLSQPSWQIVPQIPLKHISTRPSPFVCPSDNLKLPFLHTTDQ